MLTSLESTIERAAVSSRKLRSLPSEDAGERKRFFGSRDEIFGTKGLDLYQQHVGQRREDGGRPCCATVIGWKTHRRPDHRLGGGMEPCF